MGFIESRNVEQWLKNLAKLATLLNMTKYGWIDTITRIFITQIIM